MNPQDETTPERIRRVRQEISAACGHDPDKLVEYYMRLQDERRDRRTPRDAAARAGKSAA